MSSWAELAESSERLRLSTARLKARRLGLPSPGTTLRVIASSVALRVVRSDADGRSSRGTFYRKGETLLLVSINTTPRMSADELVSDPIELILIGRHGLLVTSGPKPGSIIMHSYEVIT